jgi:hypothetical protein
VRAIGKMGPLGALTYRQWESMKVDWKEHIISTPDVIRGKPRIKGTRIPVSLILGYYAAGSTATNPGGVSRPQGRTDCSMLGLCSRFS